MIRPGRWRRALADALRPPATVEQVNIRLLCREIAWFGIVSGISGTFTGVLAVRLQATNQMLGLMVSLPALVGILLQLPAARLLERLSSSRRAILAAMLLNRLGYLAIGILPWVFATWRPQALVGITVLMAVPATVGNIGFTSILARVVSSDQRARVVGIRNTLIHLTSMGTVLVAGRLLDAFTFPINYQGAFFIAFIASMLSLADVARIRLPREVNQAGGRQSLIPFRKVLANRRFVGLAVGALAAHFAINAPSALYAIYRVRVLEAPNTWIGILGTVETAVGTVAAYAWGRQAARWGNRIVLLIGVLGLVPYPLITALSTRVEPLLIPAIIGGLFGPAFNIALFSLLLDVAPREGLPTYIGVYNVVVHAATFAAPLLGTTLADELGIRAALLITAGLRLACVGVLFRWMRDVPAVERLRPRTS